MSYDLSKEFIEKILNQPIVDFEAKAGSKEGDNVQGELKAVKVETANGKLLHLIHKTMAPDPFSRMFIVESQTFRIENTFYSRIAPAIEKLIKSRNPSDFKLPIPYYYAGFNNDSDDYLTMEDLRPSGYVMPDKYEGLSVPQVSLVLKHLGRYHAFTYFFLKHEGEQFFDTVESGIKKSKWTEPEKKVEGELISKGVSDYVIDIVSKQDSDLGVRVANKISNVSGQDLMMKTMSKTDIQYFPLLLHGDLWVNNILFKYDEDGTPVDVKFIDFQMVRRGNMFEDLQYFFFTSTTPEFRRNHLSQALGEYYDAFKSALDGIECPLPPSFSRGALIDGFHDCFLPGYFNMGFAISMQLGEKPSVPNFENEIPKEGLGEENKGGPPKFGTANGGPANNNVGSGEHPPAFNFLDIPVEARVAGFIGGLRAQLEASPRAIGRLMDLTREMAERNVI